jgi:phage gpG-like protein
MENSIKHLTEEDFNLFKKHRTLLYYTTADANELMNIVRKYVDPHIGNCLTCNNTLRHAKDIANQYYENIKNEAEVKFYSEEKPKTNERKKSQRKTKEDS